jgi:hypothetical protein
VLDYPGRIIPPRVALPISEPPAAVRRRRDWQPRSGPNLALRWLEVATLGELVKVELAVGGSVQVTWRSGATPILPSMTWRWVKNAVTSVAPIL